MKINKFLQGLVGFGNLRFAEIKSRPSAYQTYELSERRFPHCKIDKIWIFPEFGQMPLGGSLTATVNGKVVWDAFIWCLAVSGVDFA